MQVTVWWKSLLFYSPSFLVIFYWTSYLTDRGEAHCQKYITIDDMNIYPTLAVTAVIFMAYVKCGLYEINKNNSTSAAHGTSPVHKMFAEWLRTRTWTCSNTNWRYLQWYCEMPVLMYWYLLQLYTCLQYLQVLSICYYANITSTTIMHCPFQLEHC